MGQKYILAQSAKVVVFPGYSGGIPKDQGAYGVENGTVEVVDVEKDTVIASYPVSFFPVG